MWEVEAHFSSSNDILIEIWIQLKPVNVRCGSTIDIICTIMRKAKINFGTSENNCIEDFRKHLEGRSSR